MLEPRILVCGPALNMSESEASLERLRHLSSPIFKKFVVTTDKFDSLHDVRSFSVEAEHPPEPAYLKTLGSWAGNADLTDQRFRDGYDLFCLRAILSGNAGLDFAILLREADQLDDRLPLLLSKVEGCLFLAFDSEFDCTSAARSRRNLLVDLSNPGVGDFLHFAWQLYVTGAVYAIDPYSLEDAMKAAAEGARIAADILCDPEDNDSRMAGGQPLITR